MSENRFSGSCNSAARETVSIEANRILDACRDRDCFEDARVILTTVGQEIISRTNNVRVKSAEIVGSYIGIDPVQFNCGFYTVTIKFYVKSVFEACVPVGYSQEFEGVTVLEKKVVLYGGSRNINTFRSQGEGDYCSLPTPVFGCRNKPEAVVEVADPVVLNARVVEQQCDCCCWCCCRDVPTEILDCVNGAFCDEDNDNVYLTISIGLFSVVRLVRPGQFLVQATEFCIPDKECVSPEENNPCQGFRKMPFPTAEFCLSAAPAAPRSDRGCHCQ